MHPRIYLKRDPAQVAFGEQQGQVTRMSDQPPAAAPLRKHVRSGPDKSVSLSTLGVLECSPGGAHMPTSLLERKQTHFVLWRPGPKNPPPKLIIGAFQAGRPPTLDQRQD